MIYLPLTKEAVHVSARVSLSVCLLARLPKGACMDLDEMLHVDRCRDMDELKDLEAVLVLVWFAFTQSLYILWPISWPGS